MATNEVFEFLNGRFVKIDGVAGRLRHEVHVDWLGLTVERLMHDATPAGRRSHPYRATRRRLGDDYSTDLTQNIERYCELAVKLGYEWPEPVPREFEDDDDMDGGRRSDADGRL